MVVLLDCLVAPVFQNEHEDSSQELGEVLARACESYECLSALYRVSLDGHGCNADGATFESPQAEHPSAGLN